MGCTDGKRFTELYENVLQKVSPRMKIQVAGVDRKEWKEAFTRRFYGDGDSRCTPGGPDLTPVTQNIIQARFFTKAKDALLSATPNIVHLSHVLYSPRDAKLIVDLLKKLTPGSLVFIRGIAANSPFQFVSVVWSAKAFGPFPQHSWVNDALRGVVESCHLEALGEKQDALQHDWLIIQDMLMEKQEHARALVQILDGVFNHDCEEFAAAVYENIARQSVEGTCVPNWDVLYVYRKQ
jgi:hypothetical protein